MAMNARSRKGPDRRVSVYVPMHIGIFLDLVCKYGLRRKGALVDDIWAAGIYEVFGMTLEEITQSSLRIPPGVGDGTIELEKLAVLLCGVES